MLFQGVWPAITTPFHENGELDKGWFVKKMRHQFMAGVDGIILGGTLGEASTLSLQDKMQLASWAKETNLGPIAMNIAESQPQDAVKLVAEMEVIGIDGFMLLPPMRYVSDERETLAFLIEVIQSTEKPILLYNNPVDYRIELTPAILDQLARFPHVQAIKESTRDIRNMSRMINEYGDRYAIMCGVDNIALESLMMGAKGWVAGLVCAFPEETVQISNLVHQGDLEKARSLYQWFLPLLDLDVSTKLVQNIKLVEELIGVGTHHVRKPRLPLVGSERDHVVKVTQRAMENRGNYA